MHDAVRPFRVAVPLAYLQELCAYWADEYDWRRAEARLNVLAQFVTEIDGVSIHFAQVAAARCVARCAHPRLARLGIRVPGRGRATHARR